MKRLPLLAVLVISLGLVLSACRSQSARVNGKGPVPDRLVAVLLDKGQLDEATRIVVREEAFFAGSYGNPAVRALLDRYADDLAAKHGPYLDGVKARIEAIQWPAPLVRWDAIRKELASLHTKLAEFIDKDPFQYSIYRPDAYGEAVALLKAREKQVRNAASTLFVEYPLTAERSFFELYPVPVDGGLVMRANEAFWAKELKAFSKAESDLFFANYGKYLPKSAQEIMGQKYFDSLCPNPKTADIKTIVNAYRKVQAAGMELDTIPGLKVAFLQVTNPDLIRTKSVDFPLSIKIDVPFDASKASMRKMFSHDAVKEADIVILVNVSIAKARRVAARNEKIESMFISSYMQIENPEYAIVKTELEAASKQYHEAEASNDYTWGASIIEKLILEDPKEEKVRATRERMDTLKERMRETPMYTSIPNYQPYQVIKAHMDLYKFATVNYYVIDKRKSQYFRDTFDYKEKSFFTVCYGMQESDQNREKLLQTSVLEEDVVRHELEPVTVNLSDLLDQYVNTPSSWKRYASMMAIHRAVAADSERAQKKFNETDYRFDRYYDKRFDSVVVVRNLGKGIGSGFYITDDMVITNYHVVEENEYVRLKLFDERETMGRVVARDAHLDLAVVQADVKGKPVCFYNKREIPLGVPLEIIGHPDGFQFSITRGVLSGIRKEKPVVYVDSRGNVTYIQTDAATNGGNSGGPVFYGNYVVGVHDWGKKQIKHIKIPQGLNFSIHYSEVFKFLDHHDIEVCKGSK